MQQCTYRARRAGGGGGGGGKGAAAPPTSLVIINYQSSILMYVIRTYSAAQPAFCSFNLLLCSVSTSSYSDLIVCLTMG